MRSRYAWVAIALLLITPVLAQDAGTPSIGQRFHLETGFGAEGSKTLDPHWGRELPVFKTYDGADRFSLPIAPTRSRSVEEAIAGRQSVRSFSSTAIPLDNVGRLLLAAYGISQPRGETGRRSVPSGGGFYPMEIYLCAGSVESLPAGLYHFRPADTSLERIHEGDFSSAIREAANNQRAFETAPLALIMTARFDRMTQKYADRGYRYIYIEAGAICQNVYLQAGSLGLGTCAVGAFNDDAVNTLLEIDGVNEAAILLMPIGLAE